MVSGDIISWLFTREAGSSKTAECHKPLSSSPPSADQRIMVSRRD